MWFVQDPLLVFLNASSTEANLMINETSLKMATQITNNSLFYTGKDDINQVFLFFKKSLMFR